jgi:hypothetical protein
LTVGRRNFIKAPLVVVEDDRQTKELALRPVDKTLFRRSPIFAGPCEVGLEHYRYILYHFFGAFPGVVPGLVPTPASLDFDGPVPLADPDKLRNCM